MAQSSPLNVVQSSDGTLYLEQGSNAWTMVPNSISDSDLAALTPSGELDGAIPAAFLGTPGAPTLLQVVQGSDGTFYIAQGTNVWTLVPNQIADADLAALNQVGEVDGTISTPALAAPAQPVAAPATVAPAAPTPTTQAAPPQAVAAPATATPAPVAQGSFLGHQLALEVDYPNWGTVYAGPETLTVGQSSQFNNVSPCPSGCATVTVRVGANTLDFSWGSAGTWPTGQASAYVLTTGPGTPPITSASLTKMSGWGGTPRLSVAQAPGATGNNQIRFDVGGCTYSPATTATITVAFGS
ncbi:MAG: hypothetical protein JOZ87_33340 [Chloroflexi bacterium]|nr:hypothetical protein [Chloroflexota bacterium]